ncbi:hypothetical protein EAO77_36755, partial [Streptomyces sp. t39]
WLNASGGAGGRFVTWANHDSCAKNMLATLAVIEAEQLADRITVVTRSGTGYLLLEHSRLPGRPGARAASGDRLVGGGPTPPRAGDELVVIQHRAGAGHHGDAVGELLGLDDRERREHVLRAGVMVRPGHEPSTRPAGGVKPAGHH